MYQRFKSTDAGETKYLFFTGKGGVGKTSISCAVAVALADRGKRVLLVSTDPASNLQDVFSAELTGHGSPIEGVPGLTVANLNPAEAAREYRESVVAPYRGKLPESVIAQMEEQLSGSCTVEIAAFDRFSKFITDEDTSALRSPCTQEIAVFRAFAEIVDKSENEVIVIDTAPTGHTLLLLDAAQSYHREVRRTKGEVPQSVANLLPRLRDKTLTEAVIVTLPEATPVFEATRLKDDLERAGIHNTWWVVNQCMSLCGTDNPILSARAEAEKVWLSRVSEISGGHIAAIAWRDK
ncbi:hypothetical protein FACS1894216_04330 [Synergistales bacterium]|nr:hypothetical protein FACS1894216_04330 [Synergistales bacterium]